MFEWKLRYANTYSNIFYWYKQFDVLEILSLKLFRKHPPALKGLIYISYSLSNDLNLYLPNVIHLSIKKQFTYQTIINR